MAVLGRGVTSECVSDVSPDIVHIGTQRSHCVASGCLADAPRELVHDVSRLLTYLVSAPQRREVAHAVCRGPFESVSIPAVAIQQYVIRLLEYMRCSNACYVIALILLRRLVESDDHLTVRATTVHRTIFTAVVLAAKSHDDSWQTNAYYALVGGVGGSELNSLELQFLKRLNWRVHVSLEEYEAYASSLRGFDARQATHRERFEAFRAAVTLPRAKMVVDAVQENVCDTHSSDRSTSIPTSPDSDTSSTESWPEQEVGKDRGLTDGFPSVLGKRNSMAALGGAGTVWRHWVSRVAKRLKLDTA